MPIRVLVLSMEKMGCSTMSVSMFVFLVLSTGEVWQGRCCSIFAIMLPIISFIVITVMPMSILGIEEV